MEIILLVLFFLIGVSVGSFLNVVADRVPLKQSIVSPPSHCFNCGHVLVWKDMVPVVSYLVLKGKCRYCGASITPRSMIIELVTGLIFVLAWLRFGAGLQLAAAVIYSGVFIVLSITDFEDNRMPAIFTYCAIIVALILAAAYPVIHVAPDLAACVAGFASGFGLLALVWLIFKLTRKEIMAFLNVWIAGMIGASIGFPLVVLALAIALMAVAVFAAGMWLIVKKRPERVPVTAILCCSALIIMYTGQFIIDRIWPFPAP